jgi:hypothetical protein
MSGSRSRAQLSKIRRVYWRAGGFEGRLRTQRLQRVRAKETEKFARSVQGFARTRFQEESLARINFAEGVSTYVLGFYVASIFHSSLAAELALLVGVAKRREKSDSQASELPRKLRDFSKLIDTARDLGLMDEHEYQTATDIRLMRNTYVHFYNTLFLAKRARLNAALISEAVEGLSNEETLMKDKRWQIAFANLNREEVARKAAAEKAVADSIPVLDVSAFIDPDAGEFFDRRTKALVMLEMRRLVLDDGFNFDDIQELMIDRGRFMGVDKYDRKRLDALDALSWSHDLLKTLGTIS